MPWGLEPRVPLEVPGPNSGTDTHNANELISTISRITDSGLSEGIYAGGSLATTPSAGGSVQVARTQRPLSCSHAINPCVNTSTGLTDINGRRWWQSWNKKYVLLCGTCGVSSVLLGVFYLIIYIVLCAYTSSLQFFQTVPIYIPAVAMLLTGVAVLCFIRRKSRHAYAIKLVGFMCLVCAVLCVIVTVTTTVIHMNRLQTLRECTFYTQLHSCTCLPFTDEPPFELKLDKEISNCDVIHGPLYSCLRAMFGVSVIGILVSIFSCMLVYQLLSHEKKKMYWEQLESRRRLFMRRSQSANCGCCDEYGFTTPSEVYPWAVWDSIEDRYWNGGTQVYSPVGEDTSHASRSVLVGGGTPVTPSLWLPWGGAWGTHTTHAQIQNGRESLCLTESTNAGSQSEVHQPDGSRPRSTGVLLRPLIPRSLESRFGLRRQAPTRMHGQRPLSDPGVALQLPRYPPPFSEPYIPPVGLEALPRYMWDPPPPYSQPTSSENIASSDSSAARRGSNSSPHINQRAISSIASPSRRPTILADLILDNSHQMHRVLSPNHVSGVNRLATHIHQVDSSKNNLTTSLPLNQRVQRLPISHVKSLDDINEVKKIDPMAILMCDGKLHLNRFHSQVDVPKKLLKNKHFKSGSDLRTLYAAGKYDQESELYFADVSSCVSGHNEDILYYSEPIVPDGLNAPLTVQTKLENHLYEAVTAPEDDVTSHHNSDDTMIVHTSSENSNCTDDNAYSVTSPLTDQSSASPMATDTDAYSCYSSMVMPSSSILDSKSNNRKFAQESVFPNSQIGKMNTVVNDNERQGKNYEQQYESLGSEESSKAGGVVAVVQSEMVSSDLNGNIPEEEQFIAPAVPSPRSVQIRYGLSLPLRQELTFATAKEANDRLPEAKLSSPNKRKGDLKSKKLHHERAQLSNSEPNTPIRESTPNEILFTLKSVNV